MRAGRNNFFVNVVVAASVIFSCSSQKKYSQELLAKVYVENMIVEGKFDFNADSFRTHKQKVFDRYKISSDQFKSALKEYQNDSKKWESFFKKANLILDSLKTQSVIN